MHPIPKDDTAAHTRPVRNATTAALAVLLSALAVLSTLLVAAPASAALPCDKSPSVIADAQFDQRVCHDRPFGEAGAILRVFFRPGYLGSHVTDCSVYLVITDDTTGTTVQDHSQDCTTKARIAAPGSTEIFYAPLKSVVLGHRLHVTGWMNVRTDCCYYNTYPQASRVAFTG